MYSRYKIQMPSPPPDYAGTAFETDSAPSSAKVPTADNPPTAQQPVNTRENPTESMQETRQDARWEGPQGILPDALPEEPLDPGFTLPPEEEVAEEGEKREEQTPGSESDAGDQTPQTGSDAGIAESLLAQMNPDDLLFIGAMLYLLSGKNGDDSFLLLAYLLTCGL